MSNTQLYTYRSIPCPNSADLTALFEQVKRQVPDVIALGFHTGLKEQLTKQALPCSVFFSAYFPPNQVAAITEIV